MSAPTISLQSFPWRRKWTEAEMAEILDRKDLLVEAMTDAQGPVGQWLNMPPEVLHILALHMALAGATVEDRLAYIVSKPYEPPDGDDERLSDDSGRVLLSGLRHWVLKENYQPSPPDPSETAAKAKAAADQIKRQLPPEVTEALTALLAEQARKDSAS